MKKVIISLILISITQLSAQTGAIGIAKSQTINSQNIAISGKIPPIEDELIKSDIFPKIKPSYIKNNEPIVDELIQESPQSENNNAIKLWARKNYNSTNNMIEDELINSQFKSKYTTFSRRNHLKTVIEDNFAKNNINKANLTSIRTKNIYDFTKKQIPVQLKIIKNLTTKNRILEGEKVMFKTVNDIVIDGRLIPKNTKIIGKIETISESDKMGTPFILVIDNFYLADNPDIYFYGNISKTGANRSIWVYPLYQAGNICLYAAGFAFVPIHGGHAKVNKNETFTVYYETK